MLFFSLENDNNWGPAQTHKLFKSQRWHKSSWASWELLRSSAWNLIVVMGYFNIRLFMDAFFPDFINSGKAASVQNFTLVGLGHASLVKDSGYIDPCLGGRHWAEKLESIISFHLYNIPVRGIFHLWKLKELNFKNRANKKQNWDLNPGFSGTASSRDLLGARDRKSNQTIVNQKRFVILHCHWGQKDPWLQGRLCWSSSLSPPPSPSSLFPVTFVLRLRFDNRRLTAVPGQHPLKFKFRRKKANSLCLLLEPRVVIYHLSSWSDDGGASFFLLLTEDEWMTKKKNLPLTLQPPKTDVINAIQKEHIKTDHWGTVLEA